MSDATAPAPLPPAARLSFAFAKRHGVLVRAYEGEDALVTCREGADPRGIAEVRRHLGRRLRLERVPADTFDENVRL